MRKLLLCSIVLGVALFSACAYANPERAQEFTLNSVDNNTVSLSDYHGKVVLLNFFATWCPPCREELPSVQKLSKQLAGKKFAVVAVAIDRDDPGGIASFVKNNKYTFTVLTDSDNSVANKYGVSAVPTVLLIDRKGNIANRIVGGRDWSSDESIKMIKALISAK